MSYDFPSHQLTLNISHSINDFSALKTEWDELLSASRCLSVCLHWDWMNLWWKHFHTDNFELVLITIREEDNLVGIFPLVNIKKGKTNKLYFMGTGEDEKEEVTSEYIDIIARAGYEEKICQLIIHSLKYEYTNWNQFELFRFLKNSVIATYLLNEAWMQNIKHLRYLSGFRHFVSLHKSYDEYLSTRSQSFKKNLRNYTNRLKKEGEVTFKLATTKNDVNIFLNQLKTLHLKRFHQINKISAFESAKFTNFHKELSLILFKKKHLQLGALFLDDEIIAVEYNFSIDRTCYAYQGGFDMRFEKLSAGFLSINKMIESSIASNKRIYDFMMNEKDAYMSTYGDNKSPVLSCCIFNHSTFNKLMYSMMLIKIFIKESIKIITRKEE